MSTHTITRHELTPVPLASQTHHAGMARSLRIFPLLAAALASSLGAACTSDDTSSSNTESDGGYGKQYDVTETGIVPATLNPRNGEFDEPVRVSSDWLELRLPRAQKVVYLPNTRTSPDLGFYHFGRSDLRYPTAQTLVDLDVKGLDWHTGDSLQLVSPNVGTSIHDPQVHFGAPSEGSTELGAAMNWMSAESPLIDAEKGDRTWLTQMSFRAIASGGHYQVLDRAGLASDFTTRNGATSKLRSTLAPIALNRSLDFAWQGSAYAELVAQAGPYARPAATPALSLRTLPQVLIRNNNFHERFFMYLPSLVDFGPLDPGADMSQQIQYGNPFSTDESKWADFVSVIYSMPVVIPGGGVTHAMIVQGIPIDALAKGVRVAPSISPVRNVMINGQPADIEQTGVGATPEVSWSAPELGTASTYAVTIQAIRRVGRGKTVSPACTLYTTATSITLPEKATRALEAYVLDIAAISTGSRNLASKPFQSALPYASAEHVTARIAP